MRRLSKDEQDQRGCVYCLYMTSGEINGATFRCCPIPECPFHELDGYKTYQKYLKATGKTKSMKQILKDMGIYIWSDKKRENGKKKGL